MRNVVYCGGFGQFWGFILILFFKVFLLGNAFDPIFAHVNIFF